MRRVVAQGVRGQRVGVPFEIYFEIQKPQAWLARLGFDYTPMSCPVNVCYKPLDIRPGVCYHSTAMETLTIEPSHKVQNHDVPSLRRKCHDCTREPLPGESRCKRHKARRLAPYPKPKHLPWCVLESRVCARGKCAHVFVPKSPAHRHCSVECAAAMGSHYLRSGRQGRYCPISPEKYMNDCRQSAKAQTTQRRGMPEDEFERRVAAQNNICPIGNHPFVGRGNGRHAPARDHCHVTGLDRAILCGEHNRSLGGFHDSLDELQDALAYLREWHEKHLDKSSGSL